MSFSRRWHRLALVGLLAVPACATNHAKRGDGVPQAGAPPAASGSGTQVPAEAWPRFTLQASQSWLLNSPHGERFDASGLLLTPSGQLLTVNDRGPELYAINFTEGRASADLVLLPNCFTPEQLKPLAGAKTGGHYDCEGMAQDEAGRLYLCEETDRWILRWDPKTEAVERLAIDWSPVKQYFSATDSNASFEGIAVGRDRLYVANEREKARLIVVDLARLKVVDHFVARPTNKPKGDVQYSDLCWFEDALWVLCRKSQVVLKVDPAAHQVLAEYDYRALENAPATRYFTLIPFGLMEGLAVDKDNIWLVTDNNGLLRTAKLTDTRPTLYRCPRPDRKRDAYEVPFQRTAFGLVGSALLHPGPAPGAN